MELINTVLDFAAKSITAGILLATIHYTISTYYEGWKNRKSKISEGR